jgi:hypothetical protein
LLGKPNVGRLPLLASAREQDDDCFSMLTSIDTVSCADMDTQLDTAFSDGRAAKIACFAAEQTDPRAGMCRVDLCEAQKTS